MVKTALDNEHSTTGSCSYHNDSQPRKSTSGVIMASYDEKITLCVLINPSDGDQTLEYMLDCNCWVTNLARQPLNCQACFKPGWL